MTDTATTTAPTVATPTAAKYREFAAEAGIPVGTRGTIPASLKDAFAKAPKRTQKRYL